LRSLVKEMPPAGGQRRRNSQEPVEGSGGADAEPQLEISSWVPAAAARRDAPPTTRQTQRAPPSPAPISGDARGVSPLGAELAASLARFRQRFRDVTAVVEGLGGLRSLGGEEALIEMAMFAQSHERTLELAWEALADCEQLARQLTAPPASMAPEPGPVSSAPTATERVPAAAREAAAREAEPAAPAVDAEGPEEEEGNVTQVDIAPIRVLVVDDDPTVLRAFRRVLAADHEVLTARDGAEALRVVLGGERVDAIICDIGMPKLDGPAFFSELFELRPQMMPRVVFCTGGQPNEKTQRFLERLQAPLLYKPVAVADLRRAIETVRSR
jgi:CheY-like chemotaxis protein